MARTRDPNDEISDFDKAAKSSIDLWARSQTALSVAAADLDVRKAASLDAFLRVAVAWEGFRSRWHMAAINRDSSVYATDIERRFRASTRAGNFAELESHLRVSLPKQLSVAAIERLLDRFGHNISFGTKWVDRARNELAPRFADRVIALSPSDLRLVAAAEKVRNAIVHHSHSSISEMNTALVVLDAITDADLVRGRNIRPTGIATYLHAASSGESRVEKWHRRLGEVASQLTVIP